MRFCPVILISTESEILSGCHACKLLPACPGNAAVGRPYIKDTAVHTIVCGSPICGRFCYSDDVNIHPVSRSIRCARNHTWPGHYGGTGWRTKCSDRRVHSPRACPLCCPGRHDEWLICHDIVSNYDFTILFPGCIAWPSGPYTGFDAAGRLRFPAITGASRGV